MTELTAEAEANVKSRLMEFCLVLTYRLSVHATLLRMYRSFFANVLLKDFVQRGHTKRLSE